MRMVELLENEYYLKPGEEQIGDIIFKTWSSKYPDVELFIESYEETEYHLQTKKDVERNWHVPTKNKDAGEYNFVLHVNNDPRYFEEDEKHIYIESAFAGEYKGVTFNILKNIMNHTGIDTLVIDDDRSGGIWLNMAKKLKVKYVNDSGLSTSEEKDFREIGSQ